MPAIKYKKKTYAGATFPVLEMTKAEYDALSESKKMDGTVYMITDGTGGWEAENSSYDNTTSGLSATNVQDALDEVAKRVQTVVPRSANLTVNASSSATLSLTSPTIPDGYVNLGPMFASATSSGTTDAINASFINVVGIYVDSSGWHAIVRNYAPAAAKFSLDVRYLLARA